jgi:hypothetical protein
MKGLDEKEVFRSKGTFFSSNSEGMERLCSVCGSSFGLEVPLVWSGKRRFSLSKLLTTSNSGALKFKTGSIFPSALSFLSRTCSWYAVLEAKKGSFNPLSEGGFLYWSWKGRE